VFGDSRCPARWSSLPVFGQVSGHLALLGVYGRQRALISLRGCLLDFWKHVFKEMRLAV